MDTQVIIQKEIEKISSLSIFDDKKRQELINAAPYITIPYMPVKVDFIEKYILNDNEFPLVESKLSQAAIELKSRVNRLVDAQFNIDKLVLEIKELEIDIEDIRKSPTLTQKEDIQIKKKELEIKQKKWLIHGYMTESETNYQEFVEWKKTIEDCLNIIKRNDPTIDDISKIPYGRIRSAEMEIKVMRWKQMQKNGVELTPSQKALLTD